MQVALKTWGRLSIIWSLKICQVQGRILTSTRKIWRCVNLRFPTQVCSSSSLHHVFWCTNGISWNALICPIRACHVVIPANQHSASHANAEEHEESWQKSAQSETNTASNLPYSCHGSAYLNWGARKASLRLTDFFTGVQQQIFLVLAMVLLILLGDKKSLLGLDRFLHRGTAANLPHACHVSSNFLGWRNAS